jgi:uncharacterized protein
MLPLLVAAGARAQGGLTIPPPRGFVNDFAGVLQPSAVETMEAIARTVRDRSGGEIAIVTLRDIGGREAADVALQIGRDWKVGANAAIGDARRNAGVVVLLVPKETSSDGSGQISIQVGEGAEGFLTDAAAGQIRREATEYFRRGDYSTGLLLITTRVAERYAAEFGFSLDSIPGLPAREVRPPQGFPPAAAVFLVVVIVVLLTSSRRGGCGCLPFFAGQALGGMMSSGRGGWHGGGFGGGGFGGGGFGGFGGGGGFSGGGSSGRF